MILDDVICKKSPGNKTHSILKTKSVYVYQYEVNTICAHILGISPSRNFYADKNTGINYSKGSFHSRASTIRHTINRPVSSADVSTAKP